MGWPASRVSLLQAIASFALSHLGDKCTQVPPSLFQPHELSQWERKVEPTRSELQNPGPEPTCSDETFSSDGRLAQQWERW